MSWSKIYDSSKVGTKVRIATIVVTLAPIAALAAKIVPCPRCY